MTKRQKGFSLAEVLITLLIVGVVGAAAIPTMTKRQTGTDKMWDWADYPVGSAYSVGTHVLLDKNGNDVPEGLNYFPDNTGLSSDVTQYLSNTDFVQPAQDKFILFNNFDGDDIDDTANVFSKPHISFYNTNAQNNSTEYAGSLKTDMYNLALGVGALPRLQSTVDGNGLYNTAVGHYSLFNAYNDSNNTALGPLALNSLGHHGYTYPKTNNVAVGAKAQLKNRAGSYNTAVGYNALYSTWSGNDYDVALGAEALNSDHDNYFYYGGKNIGIGYKAGYFSPVTKAWSSQFVEEKASTLSDTATPVVKNLSHRLRLASDSASSSTLKNKFSGNTYISSATTIPLVQAYSMDWKNINFNINADELIVNTADGTHTILKIRMKDDSAVLLPELTPSGYKELNYCKGEGSEDIKKADNDPSALAEVCIAKFAGIPSLEYVLYEPSIEAEKQFFKYLNTALENTKYTLNGAQNNPYEDWDIFIKRLNVGASGYTSTGLDNPAYIQTVKASLNYLDTWKEGMGIISVAMQSFKNNFLCFFAPLGADCGSGLTDKPMTLRKWFDQKINEIKAQIREIFSDRRLKNISGKSTAGLKEINALKIKNYTFKSDKAQTPHVGVIAQELQKVFPNSVIEGSDGYLRIKKEEMFFAMVNAIKELDKKDKELRAEIPMVNKQIKDAVDQNKKLLTKNELLKIENEKLQAQLKEIEAQQ